MSPSAYRLIRVGGKLYRLAKTAPLPYGADLVVEDISDLPKYQPAQRWQEIFSQGKDAVPEKGES